MDVSYVFLAVLPVVAFLYAAVGHGGASGYLALMALFSFAPQEMKSTALLLNLFVAGISFFHFARSGHFRWKLFVVFAVASIPMSFLGGRQEVDAHVYKLILGFLLLFAIARMLGLFGQQSQERVKVNWILGLCFGGLIGYFSGLIGIGGGIILSPVILLLRWGNVKEAAATSALFIWVNSASGLAGQFSEGAQLSPDCWIMVVAAVVGGFLGGYFGSTKWNNALLRYVLVAVLLAASVKLIFV